MAEGLCGARRQFIKTYPPLRRQEALRAKSLS